MQTVPLKLSDDELIAEFMKQLTDNDFNSFNWGKCINNNSNIFLFETNHNIKQETFVKMQRCNRCTIIDCSLRVPQHMFGVNNIFVPEIRQEMCNSFGQMLNLYKDFAEK